MSRTLKWLALCLSLLLALQPLAAIAEETEEINMEGLEIEGVANDDEYEEQFDALDEDASIEGLTPLYTTKIKAFTANGTSIRMRARQSNDSRVVCSIRAGKTITVYAVYPTYVLAEYNGNVGYITRTWIDENMVNLDPENNPPYGVVPHKYVATVTGDPTPVYKAPSLSADTHAIKPGIGSKVAILDFVNGFAKVIMWRSYGYIHASQLTDLVVVAQGDEPMSQETPIAAFSSFFEYNTGKEGNEGRCLNIVRSCELMTRTMQPGEELDFNAQIGPYKRSNGYHPAPVLIAGGSQLGYGGGTCQSSSTLYNTVRQVSGVTIIKRRPHGPGCAKYLPMHQDAAVGNKELNFIFRNDCEYPIRIVAESTGEGSLCIQVFRAD
ncbi:MAG: VanW family protein [Clostridia bacterium]|nr:VanW family protein [Clostridia bacterium]